MHIVQVLSEFSDLLKKGRIYWCSFRNELCDLITSIKNVTVQSFVPLKLTWFSCSDVLPQYLECSKQHCNRYKYTQLWVYQLICWACAEYLRYIFTILWIRVIHAQEEHNITEIKLKWRFSILQTKMKMCCFFYNILKITLGFHYTHNQSHRILCLPLILASCQYHMFHCKRINQVTQINLWRDR